MMEFERIEMSDASWESMGAVNEVNVFQTLPWLGFVAETQKAEPVVAAIRSGEQPVGYFTGLIVSK